MNKDVIQGNWHQIKGQLTHQWGKLTDDDVTKMQGSYEELCGVLQKKYGYSKDNAEKELNEFIKKNNCH